MRNTVLIFNFKLTVAKGPSSIFMDNHGFQFGLGGDHGITPVNLIGFVSLNSAST